ncbi:Ribosomal protein S14 [Penicillium fimorum]|uniref:Ribosomal protein S14 n=1 Tax=Penicillium fimorum TaxID=1882269 RepID=A0A9W9Y1A2_9EURO|nr:Ribosomal protein S14 [Penicillium fimorum]
MNSILGDLLPDDVVFAEDLLELGFVITDDDRIRYMGSPDQGPRFKINRNTRINKAHIEALHKAIRTIIIDRLLGMGMHFMKIPKGSKRQVPILVSGNVNTAPRVVVFCGEIIEDLAVFSYRDACDDGVSFGSILGFAKALLGENAQDSPNALILANAGHKIWYNSGWYAVTEDSYHGHHCGSTVERERQLSPRNMLDKGCIVEHVRNIFEGILIRNNFQVDARIDVIGLSEGGHAAITYLKSQWSFWSPNISSLSLINPENIAKTETNIGDLKDPQSFSWFMKYRCRGWTVCDKQIGTRLPDLNLLHGGCNTYSSGESTKSSCMITRGISHILTWMNIMHQCPAATEKFDVVPGKTGPDNEVPASLGNDIELTGSKVEVHTLEALGHMKTFLTGLILTDKMVTFFNDKYTAEMTSFSSDKLNHGDSDDTYADSESSEGDRVEKEDEYDNLPSLVPSPYDPSAPVVPSSLRDALPDLVTAGVPDGLPVTAPDAPVPEDACYDDVIGGRTGPFDLSDLQDTRAEVDED